MPGVGTWRQNLQVLKPVVCLVPVLVVDYLFEQQFSVESRLHDLAVLVNERHRHSPCLDDEVPVAKMLVGVWTVPF